MGKKLTYKYVKKQIEKEGYKLLSEEYKNVHSLIEIQCNSGHFYFVQYANFQQGKRCPICFGKQKHSYKFIKEQIEKEGYKLLSEEYINSHSKIKLRCNKGHEYETNWNSFQQKNRCMKCYHSKRIKKVKHSYKFIKEQIEKEGYELLSTEYINAHKKLKIKCNKGHKYEASYNNFKQGSRCPICFGKQKHSYKFVKEQIEKEGYELLSTEYINARGKLKIKCNKGHEYKVMYNDFKSGNKCPICAGKQSKAEKEISSYLKSLNIYMIENDRELIKPLELDILIPSHKLAIEYCGLYWHSEKFKDKNYHKEKLNKCNEAGYRLITIFEDEWIYKKEIVKNRLKYILGLNIERIYARKCTIKEIPKEQAREFIDKHHIQGFTSASIYLGAFYKEELVAVNTFIKRKNIFELNRFCININVVGIASKFIKYFQRNYKYDEIITFADLRWSEGNLYEVIGFTKDKELNPDYSYFKLNQDVMRYHKFGFRHSGMKNKLENYDTQLSERENMLNNNWLRIYDCGKIRYKIYK